MKNLALALVFCTALASARVRDFRYFPPSHESLIAQNAVIDRLGLHRIADERELAAMVARGELERPTPELRVSPSLPANRRYVLPMVNELFDTIGSEYYAQFHSRLVLDSAVRPMSVQAKLRRRNRNAAPVDGESASSHEAGTTVDIARRPLSRAQRGWLAYRLMYYYGRGMVLVEEERACFHIQVTE